MSKTLLEVKNMHVSIHTDSGVIQAVRGVSFDLKESETLAIVGESGSGKSITNKAVMGLLPVGGRIDEGEVILVAELLAEHVATQHALIAFAGLGIAVATQLGFQIHAEVRVVVPEFLIVLFHFNK